MPQNMLQFCHFYADNKVKLERCRERSLQPTMREPKELYMMLVEWDGTLDLGVEQLDEHHKKLVDILNQCYGALMLNDHHHELEEIVGELYGYTRYHFRAEEELMDRLGYTEAAAHREAHDAFVASVYDFQQRFKGGESFIAMEVLMFLKDWLVAHIQKSDRALAEFKSQVPAA